MTSGVALVTTVWLRDRARGSRQVDVLSAFLLYHISIGVDRVAVFFDGDATQQPTAETLHADVASLVAQGRIELFYRWEEQETEEDRTAKLHGVCSADATTRLKYADCVNYDRLRSAAASDVATRQMLNAELAMQLYTKRNTAAENRMGGDAKTRWLLHLDVDELLYCDGMASCADEQEASALLRGLIDALEVQRPTIHQLTAVNYEAAPTDTLGGNYFMSATKFRRHTARIPLSSESQEALRAWQARSPHSQFFQFYDNGKSLVRVPGDSSNDSDDIAVVPASVHHWKPADQGDASSTWRSVSNFYDPRRSQVSVWHEPEPRLRCCVLHFPVCGVEWLSEKYERLGDFPAVWGGRLGDAEMAIAPCFHLQARDACQAGGREQAGALGKLYETQVRVSDMNTKDGEAFWRRQLRSGVCEEITFVRDLLRSKGFTDLSSQHVTDKESDSPLPVRSSKAHHEIADASTNAAAAGFTVEKAWMLAAISEQYL